MKVALIDYGAGNLASVRKGLLAAGAEVTSVTKPAQLEGCDGIVIPGVGNFRAGSALTAEWRRATVRAIDAGTPLLGICLGMQLLFDGSDEAPDVPGLGVFRGRCVRVAAERPLKVPHVGWNSLSIAGSSRILHGVAPESYVYFAHTFAAPVTSECAASVTHGTSFAAVVERNRVAGVQFHPEQSGETGLRILRNFVHRSGA